MKFGLFNLNQPLSIPNGGTGATTASAARINLGLDPTIAQWNASSLMGIPINSVAPTDTQILKYNSTTGKVEWVTPSSSGISSTDSLTEGTTNLYFTTSRTRNSLSALSSGGINYNSSTGQFSRDDTNYQNYGSLVDHFFWGATTLNASHGDLGLVVSYAGTSANVVPVTSSANNPGVISLQTGAQVGGAAGVRTGITSILLGTQAYSFQAICRLPILPTTADNFKAYIGFSDSSAVTATPVDGVYFFTDQASGNWKCTTISNSTSTVVDSGVAPTTSFTTFRIEVSKTSVATFYINEVLVGTISTNVPNTTGRETGAGFQLLKSGGTVGTTSRTLEVDFVRLTWTN